jgi:uncharacterized iron-regulated membrane protein
MNLKKAISIVHLWLGLTSGLLVFVIAVTGSIYAFQEEIQNLTQPHRFVTDGGKNYLPPSALKRIADKELPGKDVHAVMYSGRTKAAKAIFYAEGADYYYFVYMNPYTGAVLKVKNENNDFFRFILNGHYYLWLPPKVGHVVVASATLVFFVMLVTGLVLWWPRNKKAIRQRLTIKWDGRWRRKNYDLHSVGGFYVLALGLVFATTGLVWGFEWFGKLYYGTISGGKTMMAYREPKCAPLALDSSSPAIDRVWRLLDQELSEKATIEVHIPHDSAAIAVNINPDPTTYWKTDYRYYDPSTLEEIPVEHLWGRYKNTSRADKLMRMNYDIHVGAILGLPGKVLACMASLLIASLPVTGTLIWWGRHNKKKG